MHQLTENSSDIFLKTKENKKTERKGRWNISKPVFTISYTFFNELSMHIYFYLNRILIIHLKCFSLCRNHFCNSSCSSTNFIPFYWLHIIQKWSIIWFTHSFWWPSLGLFAFCVVWNNDTVSMSEHLSLLTCESITRKKS